MLGLGSLLCLNVFVHNRVSSDTLSVTCTYVCMCLSYVHSLDMYILVPWESRTCKGVHGGSLGCVCACDTSSPATVMVNVEAIA